MADHGARLVLRDVAKRYGDVTALEPTSIEIEPGEFFSLIGPSGSGKSTLLGAVAGFIPPTGGHIEIDGDDVVSMPPFRRNIGMVFQNYALFPHMSVFDNVAFPLRLRKMAARDVRERVERMLATVRLPDMGKRAIGQLSGGQQQRVALARAAVYDPRILLMDEPLGALDKNLREEMQFEIKAFHRQIRATILYVTHDQDEAATMSDRIAIMNGGRIIQHGRPRELYEHPRNAFVASFLGDANLFEVDAASPAGDGLARVDIGGDVALKAAAPPGAGAVGGGSHVICVRPESIAIAEGTLTGEVACSNRIGGTVADAVYTAGTVRYRVKLDEARSVTVRLASQRQVELFDVGRPVTLTWPAADTLLIPKE
ncbi:ABC transporter ATP-binding protein [Kaustia mangrovi]|uniref:ABC transporter ATP-binding protein n=1 Tax=Kaustia mangrovi TaxID=2593653 RepID=A0A7S8HBI3_9HYPH|nr:ABC transporter ATP-binding protein [Kaustia mangrovi]QPC42672.1 ABC transporter ATP-binding protein [Kaustia mangrovi]